MHEILRKLYFLVLDGIQSKTTTLYLKSWWKQSETTPPIFSKCHVNSHTLKQRDLLRAMVTYSQKRHGIFFLIWKVLELSLKKKVYYYSSKYGLFFNDSHEQIHRLFSYFLVFCWCLVTFDIYHLETTFDWPWNTTKKKNPCSRTCRKLDETFWESW